MNTLTHPLSTYWLARGRVHARWAALASFVPDTAYAAALLWGLVSHGGAIARGLASWMSGEDARPLLVAMADVLWATWANPAANFVAQKVFHNLLFATAFGIAAVASRRPLLLAIALGWMLHVWTDLALHAADAYAVLWPLSARVFPAPVSYWDPDHHGRVMGALFSAMAAALWAWLAVRVWPRKALAIPCGVMALLASMGLFFGPPAEPRRSDAWVDDGITWPPELEPIAALIAEGRAHDALDAIRTTELPKADRDDFPWARNHHRARQQLLQGYAQDLRGHRDLALNSYAIAEKLEAVGSVGDKARRYRAEPFTNTPDPAVSFGWLGIFAWGVAASAALLFAYRRYAVAGVAGAAGGSSASSALPPR